jgi:hypothetical protein
MLRRSSGLTAGGEVIVFGGLRAGFGCDAYVVAGDGFAPHISLQAGIRAIGAASGATATGGEAIVLGGLRAGFGCDAYVVIRDGFAPHIPLQASIGWWGCVTAAGTGKSDRGAPVWPGKVLVDDQRRLSRSRSGWLEGDL